jgi:putative PIG3 family NAD(P)H quinone oxidoreductase
MKAIESNQNHQLQLVDRPTPDISDHEVLIKVHAAGVNRADISQRKGLYPPPKGITDILGLEISGEIVEKGKGVDCFDIGDKVCALLPGGAYAEYVAISADQCLKIPAGLSMVEAAGIPEVFFTVWNNMIDIGQLKAGQKLLIHGGSSGIGTAAIQLAKHIGATVFTTAGSEEKCQYCKQLGADVVINYKKEDFVKSIQQSEANGIDLIIDMVGGSYVQKNIEVAAYGAKIISIASIENKQATFTIPLMMKKNLKLIGSTLRNKSLSYKAKIANQLKETLWPFFENKTIRPIIYKELPLEDATQAHEILERSQAIGKVILIIN